MKTLLVLSQNPDAAQAIRDAVPQDRFRVLHKIDLSQAEPLLAGGIAQVCLLDADNLQIQALWTLEKIHRLYSSLPLLVLVSSPTWEWTDEAFANGVQHILHKPLSPRLLNILLDRLWPPGTPPVPPAAIALPPPAPVRFDLAPAQTTPAVHTLHALRDFSAMLTHSLNAESLAWQFLNLLRAILGVNRAALFLRQGRSALGPSDPLGGQRFRAACAVGLAQGLLEHFELSFDSGIGQYLNRVGRILRKDSPEAQRNLDIQKEFEVLGTEVAIPILDRESMIGMLTLDGRVTGHALSNQELELIFHLLEQLGLAIKNIWLHEQLTANHEVLVDILRHLGSACIVVSRDLKILHANKAALKLFGKHAQRPPELDFSDLPHVLGSKVYQVLQTGSAITPFPFEIPGQPGTLLHITTLPIQKQPAILPASVLLVAEDRTQTEQLRKLESEAANLRLLKRMADRMAHEIGNAMVPVAIHQELIRERFRDAEFRASLDAALAKGVKRVQRLVSQMRYLAREDALAQDAFPLTPLLEEAYQEASKHQPSPAKHPKFNATSQPIFVTGDRAALKHAFSEVMLNALQANPAEASVGVSLTTRLADTNGHPMVQIEVRDAGKGFPAELARKIPAPFTTTRTVGLGLGLCVCQKIIEWHHGKLEIVPADTETQGVVRIHLPTANPGANGSP